MAYYEASIDDNDPGFIYSGGWELVTQDGDWRGTMHSTSIPGSYARVRFTGPSCLQRANVLENAHCQKSWSL